MEEGVNILMSECNCGRISTKRGIGTNLTHSSRELSVGLFSLCKMLQIGVGLQGHFPVR